MSLNAQQILALSTFSGVGKQAILKIGNSCSGTIETAELLDLLEIYSIKARNPSGKGKIPITRQDIDMAMSKADAIIKQAKDHQIGLISYYDEIFPQNLRETRTEDGKKEDPPIFLFYKGNIAAIQDPCLAIIGTRNNSIGAEKAGLYLAEEFARRGFCIVSGLALGCDTIAHRGALNIGGRTIAFLAHGLDTIYPSQNKQLAHDIVKNGGLLLSEYKIGTPVTSYNLVNRDRLQAGIALATLVIQTGIKGGTIHAAKNCINSGKPLFVVKYADEKTDKDEKTQGNHLLVEKMGAVYLRGTDNLDDISKSILMKSNPQEPLQPTLL